MNLAQVIQSLSDVASVGSVVKDSTASIYSITNDSRQVKPGGLFVAIRGYEFDGHKFIDDALAKGAAAIICEDRSGLKSSVNEKCIQVANARKALAEASCAIYENPTQKLKVIGVTGTNGKTSTTHLIFDILDKSGCDAALMSTIERKYPGFQRDMDHTTMESFAIFEFAQAALSAGVTHLVLEVSSHALSLYRVFGIAFDAVIFTNFDIDHQDFYKNVDAYFEAKSELFTAYPQLFPKDNSVAFFNIDDTRVRELVGRATTGRIVSFGIEAKTADYSGAKLRVTDKGIQGEVEHGEDSIAIASPLTTNFNRYNLLAAVACCREFGVSAIKISAAVAEIASIRGRLTEVSSLLPFRVFIDFAHSGTGLRSVLSALREIAKARLIVVFGAGGEKDPLRRKAMGEAAATLADVSIVTCDNPRRESPQKIMDAIVSSWRKTVRLEKLERELLVEPDRDVAIKRAIEWAKANDIVCIAGKGHERGQIVGTEVFEFDDLEVAKKHIREIENVHTSGNC